jgi:hypothetical protein
MKVLPVVAALGFAALAGCAREGTNRSYAGSPGSTYDVTINPPRTTGTVSYDPTSAPAPYNYGNSGTAAMSAR